MCAMHLSCLWGHTIPVVINRLETKVYADASRLKMQVGVVGHGGHPEDTGIVPHVHVCEAKDVCRSHFSRGLYIRGRARRTHQIVPYETRPDIPTATAALRAATQPNARRHRRRARERGEMRRGAPQSWSTPPVVACSASCLLPLIARPPHTLCLGGSLNILLAAPAMRASSTAAEPRGVASTAWLGRGLGLGLGTGLGVVRDRIRCG